MTEKIVQLPKVTGLTKERMLLACSSIVAGLLLH